MEGLRGLAVFLVFLVHYFALGSPWISERSPTYAAAAALRTIGYSGVDLFFVLSGFLIYGSLIARDQPFLSFMKRRMQRIYPAFLVVFAIYCVLSFVFPAESKLPPTALALTTYLVQNLLLLPGLFPIEPMITVAWSLSFEMFYYLTIPLVIVVFGLRRRSGAWRACFFAALATAFGLYCALFGGPIGLIMFLSGILLFEAMEARRVPVPGSALALCVLLAGLLGTLLPLEGSTGSVLKAVFLFGSFFVLCISSFSQPTEWLGRAFSWTPLRWLGNMSYSYYLLHGLALKAVFPVLNFILPVEQRGATLYWALLPVAFALTLVPSAALFLLVEYPLSLSPVRRVAEVSSP
jgi:peptidoglycan/LPS O-acetylase OafA/YrhL